MQTRSSVIQRAKDGDATDLAAIYGPLLYTMARGQGLSEMDAEDVMQQTLLRFLQKLPSFTYDRKRGTFKGLLKKIVRERSIDLKKKNARRFDDDVPEDIADPSGDAVDEGFEREWQQVHLERALDRVAGEVKPSTFQAFVLLALEGWSVEETAAHLGQTPNQLAQNKRRVTQRLKNHLEELLDEA